MKIIRPKLHHFDTPEMLHESLALRVADDLHDAIDQKGYATLMLSGGNTPKPFLSRLSQEPVQWEKVRIGLVDERWVEPTSLQSNEQLVNASLLQGEAKKADFVPIYRSDLSPEASVEVLDGLLRSKLFPFDVVILGMGSDGHTASLFPNRPELASLLKSDSKQLCGVAEAPAEPKTRMTLSLAAIASCTHCYLHIEGEQKYSVYQEALSGEELEAMPIRAAISACGSSFETYYS